MAIVIELVLVPFTLCLKDMELALEHTRPVEVAIDVMFVIQLIMNFLLGYDHDGQPVKAFKSIAWRYIKSYFLLDVISTFPTLITY